MLKKLMNWLRGYLYIRIKGNAPERFINLCSNKKLFLWNITHRNDNYEFYISIKNFKKLKPIAKKTKIVPRVIKRVGLPFVLQRYRKRKGFFIGILICSLLVFIMSLFIWDISLVGGTKYTSDAMLQFLNENKVHTGMWKSKVNCQEIEETIRLKYKDIGWVSAEVKGNRLIIKIVETEMPSATAKTLLPSHIVATKDAVVKSIITRNGTPMVRPGDVVKKGQILVSGIIDVKGDFDEVIEKKPIVASASIRCKSFYEYKDQFSMNYIKKVFTKEKVRGFYVAAFGKKIFFYKPRISYQNYDIIVDEKKVHITDSYYLPFRYGTVINKAYKEEDRVYTEEEASIIAKKKLDRYIKNLEKKDVTILDNDVKITIENNVCITEGRIIVEEPACEYQEIQESEWRIEQTDEHNGDNN